MSREKRAWTGSRGFSRSGVTASLCGGLILHDWSLSATCHNASAHRSPSALGEYLLAPHRVKRSIDCTLARSAAEYRGSPASPLLTWSPAMYRGCGVGWQHDEGRATARVKLQFQQPDWKWKKSQRKKRKLRQRKPQFFSWEFLFLQSVSFASGDVFSNLHLCFGFPSQDCSLLVSVVAIIRRKEVSIGGWQPARARRNAADVTVDFFL